jgi:fructose-specific phosphotransferase system IIC component
LRERYIPAFIVLVAGAITSVINIVNKVELVTGLKRLLLVILIFYFVGLIVKAVIKAALTKFAKKEEPEESTGDKPKEEAQPEEKKS